MTIFELYFASIASWRMHPGYLRDGVEPPSLEECADIAELMELITVERKEWHGHQQQQQ